MKFIDDVLIPFDTRSIIFAMNIINIEKDKTINALLIKAIIIPIFRNVFLSATISIANVEHDLNANAIARMMAFMSPKDFASHPMILRTKLGSRDNDRDPAIPKQKPENKIYLLFCAAIILYKPCSALRCNTMELIVSDIFTSSSYWYFAKIRTSRIEPVSTIQ